MGMSKKVVDALKYLRKKKAFYLMCLPYLIGFAIFELYPVVDAFVFSFQSWGGGRGGGAFLQPTFVGLNNYMEMFSDELFVLSLKNSIIITITFVLLTTAISLVLALLLDQKIKGVDLFSTCYFIPYATAPVIMAVIMRIIFNKAGAANWLLNKLGLPAINWLGPELALFTVVIAMAWNFFGYCVVILLAGLQTIPTVFYEAASIDGAGKITQIREITLPLLKPILIVTLFLETVYGIKAYDIIYGMTGGGPGFQTLTLPYYIYVQGFENWALGYADAMGVVLFFIVLVIAFIERKAIGTITEY